MRAFWTFLTSLLLAVLPAEGFGIAVQEPDTCNACRCCVQTNTNPAPVRNAPETNSRATRSERQAKVEMKAIPALPKTIFYSVTIPDTTTAAISVPLFLRHRILLI